MKARDSKLWVALSLLVLLTLVASACAPAATPTAVPPTKAPAAATAAPAAPTVEKWPTQPVKMIVTHAAGGSADIQGRLIAPYISKYLGVNIVIENMEGAGGRKARGEVFKMTPDGQNILITGFPSTVIGELIYDGAYKSTDFTFLHGVQEGDFQLVAVAATNPIKTYAELLAASKVKPIKLSTAGTGTTDHMAAVMLKEKTGLQFDLVPFDSTADQMTALLGDKVAVMMDAVSTTGVRSDIRPLVILANNRSPLLPNVPTIKEAGFPDVEVVYSLALVAPPGLAENRRKILEDAIDKATKDPEWQAKMAAQKAIPSQMTGPQFKAFVQTLYATVNSIKPAMLKDINK
jgi:tripartite-type tricarboxylate transporter receptor subunit TctC